MLFDLHIHSEHSYDSWSNIDNIILAAKKKGLDGIAITDHNVFNSIDISYFEFKYNIWIIPGVEIYTDVGDILGLFITDDNVITKDSSKAIDEIHTQGGLAILAHPFKRFREYPFDVVKKFDAIEQVNSRWLDLQEHSKINKVDKILSMISGRTAGSDSHFLFEIGNAFLETPHLNDKNELRYIIAEGKGIPRYIRITSCTDLLSQVVKLIRKPNFRQAIRLVYFFLRQMITSNKRNRIL